MIAEEGHDRGNVWRPVHGLDVQLTPWPSRTATDGAALVPGMVVTLGPGLQTKPGRGMVHEEIIVTGKHGAELLTQRAPAELPVID